MKHKEVSKLKFDGHAEEAFQKFPKISLEIYLKEIDRIAKTISVRFPKETGDLLVTIAKIGYEILYKKQRDEAIISNGINTIAGFDGIEDFLQYIKAISYSRFATKKITIKYLNPIIPKKDGKPESFRGAITENGWPEKTIVIDGGHLNRLIENALFDNITTAPLYELMNSKSKTVPTFGEVKKRDDQFQAQYPKTACKEIYAYLKKTEMDNDVRKSLTISTIEAVALIPSYDSYRAKCEARKPKVKAEPRSTWESKMFSSYMR